MNEAHDLIMKLCAARKERDAAKTDRATVNCQEHGRLVNERKLSDISEGGRVIGSWIVLATPASKAAHRRYTTAAHKLAAATRAINKYGERHEA